MMKLFVKIVYVAKKLHHRRFAESLKMSLAYLIQQTFTCSKLTIETPEKSAKYAQS